MPVWQAKGPPEQILWTNLKKLISQLLPRLNVERLLVYINPRGTLRDCVRVLARVLSYGYGTTSVGSMQFWSMDVFLRRKAAAN